MHWSAKPRPLTGASLSFTDLQVLRGFCVRLVIGIENRNSRIVERKDTGMTGIFKHRQISSEFVP